MKKTIYVIISFFCLSFYAYPQIASEKNVEKLLSAMTLEEKVGQMAQITLDVLGNGADVYTSAIPFQINRQRLHQALVEFHVGSVLNTTNNYALPPQQWNVIIGEIQKTSTQETRMKIPVIYGVDGIHGATYVTGATLFPQQITLAASFNAKNAYNMAKVTAYETRACGIPWNFSPVLDLGADPRFSRQYEGFGEDPYLASVMGVEMVKGYEGITDSVGHKTKLACSLKHFLGYSVPFSGKDRTPAYIPPYILREYHLPAFKAAIEAGAETVMINSGIINNIPVHTSHDIITKLLKEELKFEGVVVSDWMDIVNLHTRDRVAKTNKEAVKLAVNAGIDMSMVPYDYQNFCRDLVALVKEGEVSENRVNDAVRRILKLKIKLGLLETPLTKHEDYPDFTSKAYQQMAYSAAAEAITLLKNQNNILPLKKDMKILVTGPNAHSMRALNGGWTYSWQGEKAEKFATGYNTFLKAIQNKIGKKNVSHIPGVSYIETGKYFEEKENRMAEAVAAAKTADAVVVCIGENSYTEKPGDLNDLTLSALQIKLVEELSKTKKPIILVLNEGRPRCISRVEPLSKGVIMTYLPGNYGGDALADILFGDVNPSGKLPYNYPAYPNSIVTYYHKHSEEQKPAQGAYNYESDYNPQYEFGFGLSYTHFEYRNLKVSKSIFSGNEAVQVSIDVSNTGKRAGKEAVLLYTADLYASMPPDVKRLRRFEKIELNPGETRTVQFTLTAADLAFVNTENKWITEPGEFEIKIGNQKTIITYQ